MTSMQGGGAERGLLNILSLIDYSKYEVDLFLFDHSGIFYDRIPSEVNILSSPVDLQKFNDVPKHHWKKQLIKKPSIIYYRLIRTTLQRFPLKFKGKYKKIWMNTINLAPKLVKKYDVAVGFSQNIPIYMLVDKVSAKKKIGYIHTDYLEAHYFDSKLDEYYFKSLDKIITVSESAANSLIQAFPTYRDKIFVIRNITSSKICEELSNERVQCFQNKGITILSIGRLVKEKGYDLAIDALNLLVEQGFDVYWYVIGKGTELTNLKQHVEKLKLEDRFIFLGEKENPYPYIKQSDFYVQTSKFEGWGIALEEALLLKKIVVATNFKTAYEQINNNKTGLICNTNATSIYESIKTLIENPNLSVIIEKNLLIEKRDKSDAEMEKLLEIFRH